MRKFASTGERMNPYQAPMTTGKGRRKSLPVLFMAVWVVFTPCFVIASAWCAGVFVWTQGFATHRINMNTLAKLTTLAIVLAGMFALTCCICILGYAKRLARNPGPN